MEASVYRFFLLFFLCLYGLPQTKSQPFIGVNYGQTADNLPPPSATAKLLRSTTIQKVRLYGSDPAIIKALANTGIEIVIGTGDVPGLASDPSFARSWVETNVVPYYPASKITLIDVGNEATTFGDRNFMLQLLPAMKNVQSALEAASLGGKIKVDAVYSALSSFGFKDVEIVVAETGWPYKGDPDEVGTTIENAKAYNKNLIAHLKSMAGTPLMPGKVIETYLFALYDENLKPGKGSERAFGLFKPDVTMTYDIGLTKTTNQTSMAPQSPMPRLPPAAAPTSQTIPAPPQMILPSPTSPSDKNSGQTDVHNSTPRSASLAHLCSSLSVPSMMLFVSVMYALIM